MNILESFKMSTHMIYYRKGGDVRKNVLISKGGRLIAVRMRAGARGGGQKRPKNCIHDCKVRSLSGSYASVVLSG